MADARAGILGRVRGALGPNRPGGDRMTAAYEALPRTYERGGQRSEEEILHLLQDRLRDYDAHVERVGAADLPAAIARRHAEQGSPRLIVPKGFPTELLQSDFTFDENFTPQALNQFGGVVTQATLAIALTGTLVLQNVPGQGRRAATLVPDYHLCVVRMEDVVETVPQAFARLQGTAALATTFVSGPSATADIEMTRIKGVHGPRVLDVLVVG